MGSADVLNKNRSARYLSHDIKVSQGVVGSVISKGSLRQYIPYIIQSIKHGIQYIGPQVLNFYIDLIDKVILFMKFVQFKLKKMEKFTIYILIKNHIYKNHLNKT